MAAGDFANDTPATGGNIGGFAAPAAAPQVAQPSQPEHDEPNVTTHPTRYDKELLDAAHATGVDPNVLRSIHAIEDATDDPNVKGPPTGRPAPNDHAIGEMQMVPSTFAANAKPGEKITNPGDNYMASARLINKLTKQYGGDMFKVFSAYNAGTYNAKADQTYAKQAEANFEYLKNHSVIEPTEPTRLEREASIVRQVQTNLSADSPVDKVQKLAAQAGDAGEAGLSHLGAAGQATAKYVGTAWFKSLDPMQQAALTQAMTSPAAHAVGHAVNFFSNVLGLLPEGVDAALRDISEGKATTHESEMVQALGRGMQNPETLNDVLTALRDKYEPLSQQDMQYWLGRPGLQAQIKRGKSDKQLLMDPLLLPAGIVADTERGLSTHPATRDVASFMLGFFNPANDIPGVAMGRLSKSLPVLGDTARTAAAKFGPKRTIPGASTSQSATSSMAHGTTGTSTTTLTMTRHGAATTEPMSEAFHNWAKKHYTNLATDVPFGDRFYREQVAAGKYRQWATGKGKADADQAGLEAAAMYSTHANIQARAEGDARHELGAPHLLGGTSPQDRLDLYLYRDKFNNATRTAHMHQPGGGTHTNVDPVSGAVVMSEGGLQGVKYKDHLEHVFVYNPHAPPMDVQVRSVKQMTVAPQDHKPYMAFVGKGQYGRAYQLYAGRQVSQAEGDAFQAAIDQRSAGMSAAEKKAYGKEMLRQKMLGEHSRRIGLPIRLVQPKGLPTKIIYGEAQEVLRRDLTKYDPNNDMFTKDERSFHWTEYHNALDSKVRGLMPSMTPHMRPGYISRSRTATAPGMFQDAPDFDEQMEQNLTMDKSRKTPVSGMFPKGSLVYHSVDEAQAAGKVINPEFDPAHAAIMQSKKSKLLVNYLGLLYKHAEPINYEDLFNAAIPQAAKTFTTATGHAGYKEASDEIAALAEADVKKGLGQAAYDAFVGRNGQAARDDLINKAKAPYWQKIEERFKKAFPYNTWNTAEETGIEDLGGHTVPNYIKNIAIDSHPTTHAGGTGDPRRFVGGIDAPTTNKLGDSVETLSHIMRTAFIATPGYHPLRNLAALAFGYGHLNPIDVAKVLFAPHTINTDDLASVGLHSHPQSFFTDRAKTTRYQFGSDQRLTGDSMNPYGNIRKMPSRAKGVLDAYSKVHKNNNMFQSGQHILLHGLFHADRWAQDAVFGMFEDPAKALMLRKFMAKGYSKQVAARKVADIVASNQNFTAAERALGANRVTWFFNWWKTQVRLAGSQGLSGGAMRLRGGVQNALVTQNTNNPGTQDPFGDAAHGNMDVGDDQLNVAPPPMLAQSAFQSLYSTPFTQNTGALDFAQYMARHLENSMVPEVAAVVYGAPATLGITVPGQSRIPGIPKSPGEVAMEIPQAVLKAFNPQIVQQISRANSDPLRFLEFAGVAVKQNVQENDAKEKYAKIMLKIWEKPYARLYYDAQSDAQRALIQEHYLKATAPFQKALMQATSN